MTMQAWLELYQAAMVELNPSDLQLRIENAQTAVRQRMEELVSRNDLEAIEERQKLYQAQHALQTLRRLECPALGNATGRTRFQEGTL
jgi:hypothetical protein